MASLRVACRASSCIANGRAAVRGFTTSSRCLAAHNFTMPALSPTMTEGNIATWKVKEGDSFSAGDVLLEIETDKATMDVEAQDDGIMMKIMAQGGSKSVQVGTRIAVVAEAEDDISSLEIPADEQPKSKQLAKEGSKEQPAAPSGDVHSKPAEKENRVRSATADADGNHEPIYPLLPSVGHLVKEKGLSEEDIRKIKPTGPNGRLLKGDVLAYLGSINSDAPATISSRFDKLSHLDLSNIKVATKKEAAPAKQVAPEKPAAPVRQDIEIQVPVSLAKVVDVQKRIQDTLNVFLPLSTFISRAAEVANDDLPRASTQPTAQELFDQVLGLDKVKATKGSRGVYLPQISVIPPPSMLVSKQTQSKPADIIDILAPVKKKKTTSAEAAIPTIPGMSGGDNVFSLVVPKAEEERAAIFLERCKVILEKEPGRLVL